MRDKLLDLSVPRIMGIINLTPDSFYAGSRVSNKNQLITEVESMLNHGADFIDLGSFSTRPGSTEISIQEELSRLIPGLRLIRKEFPECHISIDTFRSSVARAALSEGADIINDIGGLELDAEMIKVIAENNTPYILMHGVRSIEHMHRNSDKKELFRDVCYFFSKKIAQLEEHGATEIILDPGFGFGKTLEQNYNLLNKIELFHLFRQPLLMGVSRKSMIYNRLNTTPDHALNGSSCLHSFGFMKGVNIFRVHDVKEMSEVIKLLSF